MKKIDLIISSLAALQNDINDIKMEKHWNTIIASAAGLLGVILGFFLQRFSNWLTERKLMREEFAEIKNSIYATSLVNNLFPQLLRLKQFLIRHPKLLNVQSNSNFYQKWLTDPNVEEAFQGVGYWTQDKVKEMMVDLDKTSL